MSYRYLVQIGRIAYIAYGKDEGKLCAIIDVIDQNRAVIDGPLTDVKRQAIRFKQLRLTKFRVRFLPSAGRKVIARIWEKEKISEKWKETTTYKKMEARKLKLAMNDFDRFKAAKAKKQMNLMVHNIYLKLKKKKRNSLRKPKPKKLKKEKPEKKGKPEKAKVEKKGRVQKKEKKVAEKA